jgi:hypothetical protein
MIQPGWRAKRVEKQEKIKWCFVWVASEDSINPSAPEEDVYLTAIAQPRDKNIQET